MASEGDPPVEHSHSSKGESSASFLRAARGGNLDKVLELLRAGTDINTSNANGLNALHLASKEGHSDVVRELLKRKANVDAATRKGNTALHIASLAGQSLIVTILVENGANVNVQSLNGFTPLYMAAQENHEEVVRFLLNHGANQALSTEDGFTPLAVALQQGHDRVVALLLENDTKGKVRLPALHIAAKKDDTKAATLLLQNDHNADVTSKSGFTPLHIAAHYGNENVAQLLIEKGANVNYTARHNISPLHVATKWGRTNMVQLLLQNGAIIDSRTRDLLTPLHCAARSGHDQVVDMLLEKGAPISAKTKNGLAPLHMAAQGDHVDSARILLYHRAPVDDVTVDYLTPLHVAAHCGHVRVAKLLLDRNADPNARALNGFTPLHIACKKNRIKVVELLLKYNASIEATTESGLSPLHVAAFMGAINIVIYLLQQGANPDVATVRGETPLHLAARANQTDVVRVLIRNGAKVDAQARELQTPLHIASRLGNTDIVVLLLQAGANANSATRDQYTPLHIAAKEGQDEVASILLDHGADKTLMTKKGFTPLHLASKYGNVEVVRLLLEKGCPVDIEGKNQVTPLHVAAHYNNDKVAMLLLEHGASAKAAAKNGYTPLHIAAKKNQMDIAGTLLQYHGDPNAKSRAGFTPLHLSSQEGHKDMAALLIENGSDVGAQANNGLTSMHLCAQEDHVPVAEELYKHHAEINPKTNAGYTPLHVACHFGQLNMVRFLVEHGANVGETTRANFTPLHQAAQQGHNNVVRYLLDHGASPNEKNAQGQTPLAIAQRLGYVSVVETLKTVTETTVITETTTVHEDKYKPQNPEAMNETMFSESEDEGAAAEHEAAAAHVKDFSDNLTQGLQEDSTGIHFIHTGEQLLNKSSELEAAKFAPDAYQDNLDELIKKAQTQPVHAAPIMNDSLMDKSIQNDNIPIGHNVAQPSFLISFLVDARGGAMRGCRHSGVRIIVPPRKASQPIRVTCRYLRKDKLAHPPPLSEGEELASRILEMAPAGAKFLGPVILEVPHFASLRDREREIVILRSDDGQHWKEHQLEATEDAVQEVLNESFDAEELAALDDLQTPRITRVLTNDFPMYFAVVTRVRQEVHCVGPEGGVIVSSVVPKVQAIFPDGSLTKTIKVSVQAQPVPQEMVTRLHGNRVAVSPIVTVEPRRRKFHKPITLCIPLPQSGNKAMLTQYSGQPGQEPPTLRLLCSITGGSAPAQWEDITGTTQLTFTGEEVSFTTTVSARFWLMDCQTPRDAARMAQEVYNEAISIPYMAKFAVFARRTFPVEGQLRVFCMTDDKEDKTLEKQEHFKLIAKSRDVEVLKGKHQFLEFAGNLVPVTKSGDQLSLYFQPFQENRLAFMVKTRNKDDADAETEGRLAFMREPKNRAESLAPQAPICTLAITLPEYTGEISAPVVVRKDTTPFDQKYRGVMDKDLPDFVHQNILKGVGPDWQRLARVLEVPHRDIQQVRQKYPGKELPHTLKIWIHLKGTEANQEELDNALKRIGRDDIVRSILHGEPETLSYGSESPSSKRFEKYEKFEPAALEPSKKYVDLPPVAAVEPVVVTRHVVTHEESHIEEPQQAPSPSYKDTEQLPIAEKSQARWSEEAEPVTQTIPEEDEEAPVSEVRTVVRTERHVHDTDSGPMVEERTITTTYEDDVAVNENVVDRTVPLTDEEREKWEELHRLAESPSKKLEATHKLPDGVEQEVETEQHVENDGTIVTTTTMTSHYSETRSESPIEKNYEEEEALQASGHTDSSADSGTTQKKETAEEGFTNEDGSVVVSKKMTRVVTTTKTTLPGEGESVAPESPTESLGSVKDRIAKFEQLKEGDRASVTSVGSGGSAEKEEESKRSSLERIPVDIVVTPVSPLPPESDEEDEIAEAQEPLSPSVEEVSQAEVKSLDSYGEESPRVSEKYLEEEQEPLSPETDRSSTADLISSDIESVRKHKKREILEQSTTTTYDFTTQKEDRRHLQRGDEGEHPEDFAAETDHGYAEETALESPAGEAPLQRTEAASVRTEFHEEPESPSAADKLKSFAKGAGKVLAAPVALAAAGAVAAYEKLKGESDEEEEEKAKERPEELRLEEKQLSLEHPEDERLGTPESQKEEDQEEILRELEEEMEKTEAVEETPIPSKRTSIAEPLAEKESVSPPPIEDHWEVHREPDQVVETTLIRKVSTDEPEIHEYDYPSPVEELPEAEELAAMPVQAEKVESPEERRRREIFEQSTATTYDFSITHEDRRYLQEGDEEVPEEHAPVLPVRTPTEVSAHHVVETTKIVKETIDEGAEPHVLETTTISKEYYEEPVTSVNETGEPEVEYEERFEEPHRHFETTIIKRKYDETPSEVTSPVQDISGGKVLVIKETFFEPEAEDFNPVHAVETTRITKEYTESPEHMSPVPIEEHIEIHREPDHIVETTTVRRYSVEELEEHVSHLKRAHEEGDIAGSPAKKTHYFEEEEPENLSAADKLKDFAKGAGKVLAAPVALAAAGAVAAYEQLTGESDEEEEYHVKKTPEAEELHLEERLGLEGPGKVKEDISTIVEVGTPESQREVEQEDVLRELEAEMEKEPLEEELESSVTQREAVQESPKELRLRGLEVPEEQLAPSDLASPEDETGSSEKRRPSRDIFYDKPESPVQDRVISPSAGLPEGLEAPVVSRKECDHEEVPSSPSVSEKEEPASPARSPAGETEELVEEPAHTVETTITHRDYYEEPIEEEGPPPGVITELVEEDIGSFHHVIETTQVQREYNEQPSDLASPTGSDHDSTMSIKSGQIVHEEPEQRHVLETTTVTKETFYDKNEEEEGTEKREEHEQPRHIVETTMVTRDYYEEPVRVEEEEPLSPTRSEPIEEFIEVPHRATFAPDVTKEEPEQVEEKEEDRVCHVVETTTTIKEIYFEEKPKEEEPEHAPEEENLTEKRHVYETTTVTKEVYYEEPEDGGAEPFSPAQSPAEEEQKPFTPTEYGEEVPSDEESTKDKLLDFAKGVGKVAAGIVAAPVVLAAAGAAAAYDKLKKEDREEESFVEESPREEIFEKGRSSQEQPYSERPVRETETHEEFVSREVQELELPHEPVTESHVEKEPETHEEFVSREFGELELPHKEVHEEETHVPEFPVVQEKKPETHEEFVSREVEDMELPHREAHQETHYKEEPEIFEHEAHEEEHLEVPERPEIEKNEEPEPDTESPVAVSPIEEEHLEVPERPEIEKNEEPESAIVITKTQIEDTVTPVSVEEPIHLGETYTESHEEKLPSPTSSQKSFEERPHIVETTVVTKETFYEESSSPVGNEKGPEEEDHVLRDNAREVEIFTTTRDYQDEREELPETADISEEHHKVHEIVTTVKETFYEPSSRESPVPSEQESVIEKGSFEEEHREPQRVVETTTTVREYYEEPSPTGSEKEFHEEPSIEETTIVEEDNEPLRFVETSTTKKEYYEEPIESLEAPFEHHEPHRVVETTTVTKETYYEEPSATHEAVTPGDEESTKDKLLSFGKKAGKIAAGIAIAPIALAAVGAQSAYEKLRGDEEEEMPFWVDDSTAPPSFPPPSYESVEEEDLRRKSLEHPVTVAEHVEEAETETRRDRSHLGLEVPGEQLAPSDLTSPENETGPSEERRPSRDIFYDKPESPVQDRIIFPSAGLPESTEVSSPAGSENEDERQSVLSALVDHEDPVEIIYRTIKVISPETESFEEEEVVKPHHIVETTIVSKETFFEEPEEKTEEEQTEARHVVETTTTTKETYFEEPDEKKDEEDLHRVVETFTTTQEYEQLEPAIEKPSDTEEDLYESHYVTETTTVTKESFFDEPEEEVEGAEIPHHVVETTTTTRDIVEEPYIPETSKEDHEKHVVETTKTTTETYYDEDSEDHPTHIKETVVVTKESIGEPQVVETSTTVKETFFEEPESPTKIEHLEAEPEYSVETTVSTKQIHFEEPKEELQHVIESASYEPEAHHEEPTSPIVKERQFEEAEDYQQGLESSGESDEEAASPTNKKKGLGSKMFDFAKKAGMVVAAPVALAAMGASHAYDALKHKKDGQGEEVMHEGDERVYAFKGQEESAESAEASPETPRKSVEEIKEAPSTTTFTTETEPHVIESTTHEDFSDAAAQAIKVDTVADEEEEDFEGDETFEIASTEYHPAHHEDQIHIEGKIETPDEEKHVIESETYEDLSERADIPIKIDTVADEEEEIPEDEHREEFVEKEEKHVILSETHRVSAPAYSLNEEQPYVIESTTYEDLSDTATPIKVDTVADEEEETPEQLTEEIPSSVYHPVHHEEEIHIEGKVESPEEEEHVIESAPYEEFSTVEAVHEPEESAERRPSVVKRNVEKEEERRSASPESTDSRIVHDEEPVLFENELVKETAPVVSGYTASGEPINTGLVISVPPSPAKSLFEEQQLHREQPASYQEREQFHEEEESTKDKIFGFAKGFGQVAAGIVAAPIALAAVGAVAAYDALTGEEEEGKMTEEHLVKENPVSERKSVQDEHFVKESPEDSFPGSPASSLEEEKSHVIESHEGHFESPSAAERQFFEEIEKPENLTSATRVEEKEVPSPVTRSPLEDVQHRFEKQMEGYESEEKETHETLFEEQLEKLAEERRRRASEEYLSETAALAEEKPAVSEEEKAGDEETSVEEHLMSPGQDVVVDIEVEEEEIGGRHHIIETTTIRREYDEKPSPAESEKELVVGELPTAEDQTYHHELREEEGHLVETTTITKDYYEESEERRESPEGDEEETEGRHVVETRIVTKESFYDEPERLLEEGLDHARPAHVVETTTVTKEFYEEPEEEESPEAVEDCMEVHHEPTHVFETTTITKDYYEQPEEDERAVEEQSETHQEPRHVVETTTITREYYDEAESPAGEEIEHVPSVKVFDALHRTEEEEVHEKEPVHFTETTSITREYYEPEEKEHPDEGEQAVEEQLEAHHEPRHVIETRTITREYFEEPEDQKEGLVEETASVVSGYTASGEPINIELVISAPPSPAKSLTEEHEQQKERHVPSYEEESHYYPSDEESTKDKLLDFAKGVGKVAAGIVAAPVALAAVGAAAAYDKLKGEDQDEEEEHVSHEEHLVKESYPGSPTVSEQQFLHDEPHVIENRATHFEERMRLTSPTTSPTEKEPRFSQGIKKSSDLIAETRLEEERVSPVKESDVEEVQHRFEEEMEGYEPEEKETQETIFEEQLEKLAEQAGMASPTKESVQGSLSISDLDSPTGEKHAELEEEKSEAVRKPSLGDEFDKIMEDEWLLAEKPPTEKEVLSPGTKLEINEFVTDVVEEATAGAVIEAAEDLTPRSQRDLSLEELALENVTRVRYEQEEDEEPTGHLQSPQKQSEESPSSDQDESRLIAGDDEWKVYDSTGQVVEEFSAQLTDKAIEEAGSDVTQAFTAAVPPRRALITQESINEVSMEPETDYQSDLQEKLDILAGQKPDALPIVREEELDVIRESDGESEEHDPIAETASRLVDEVIDTVLEEQEGPKTVASDLFYSATEKSTKDDQYDTCVTSQEDTYESAQGWTSQDSEYTTATSEAPSRLSDMEERTEGTMTPQAAVSPVAVSPVDSDRQFVMNLDNEGRPRPIRSFTLDDETARSTPDVALQITIEEDEDEQKMPTSPSGVLLGPVMDVGRPISPVPPRKIQTEDDEGAFEFVARTHSKELETEMSIDMPEQEQTSGDATDESARYTRHSSELSSESHADTVIHKEKDDDQLTSTFVSQAGSTDSLDAASVKSTGRISEGSSLKAEEHAEPIEKDSPRSQDLSPEQQISPEQISPERHRDLETEEGFVIYQGEDNEGELETVEEEPEDAESLNGGSGSSSANGTAHLGRKYVSSDNVSLTSLQEFERLEQLVSNRGDSSLTASEIELYAHGRPRSMEGSLSSLAEFEKLEAEVHHQQANQSPQDEMMLSVVKEESEAEDMSVRDDDEDDAFSETEIKSRPVNEEDVRAGTPQALSPSDSLERDIITNIAILETSTDSLEPSYQREQKPSSSDIMADSLTEYEVVPRHDNTRDSLENIPMDKDSLLEGASQDLASQETHGLLSGDTVGTYQEHSEDDKDSLGGEMESMLRSYPTTLTTFITTTEQPDGSVQTISRRVETRVVDPVISHVTFTGTESQERLNQLPLEQQIETVDQQGNVTRTLFKRQPPHSE